jgi:hypothetical protein
MNTPPLPTETVIENPPAKKRGRPARNRVRLHAHVAPETMKFLCYKARRKLSRGDVIDRAVRHLEIDLMLI